MWTALPAPQIPPGQGYCRERAERFWKSRSLTVISFRLFGQFSLVHEVFSVWHGAWILGPFAASRLKGRIIGLSAIPGGDPQLHCSSAERSPTGRTEFFPRMLKSGPTPIASLIGCVVLVGLRQFSIADRGLVRPTVRPANGRPRKASWGFPVLRIKLIRYR